MSVEVIVGSMSGLKLAAVWQACDGLGLDVKVRGCDVLSGVPNQPCGIRQIAAGALTRAERASIKKRNDDAIVIAIENGLDFRRQGTYDVGVVVVLHSDLPGGKSIRISESVKMPDWAVQESVNSGFERTVGEILAERFPACRRQDPHSFLTEGKRSRIDLLVAALRKALLPLVR